MDARSVRVSPGGPERRDANARFKTRSRSWFWAALSAAVVVHFMVLAFGPPITTAVEVTVPPAELYAMVLEPPPEVSIAEPPPPVEPPPAPAVPVPAEVPADLTMPTFSFDDVGMFELAPPPLELEAEREPAAEVTPFSVAPVLKNRAEIRDELLRRYPSRLRNAGVGGTVIFRFWIDERGEITRHEMTRSSGEPELDAIAEDMIDELEFSPALNMDRPVAVAVSLPIVFRVR